MSASLVWDLSSNPPRSLPWRLVSCLQRDWTGVLASPRRPDRGTRFSGGPGMTTQVIEPRMELEQNLHMYRQMAKIRAFEEQVQELYKSAKMPGLAHLYVGEEGVAAGAREGLPP